RGALWFWTHECTEMYIPLTYTVWTLLAWLGGMQGWIYHTANVVAHVLAVLAAFALLRSILRRGGADGRAADLGACAGAMLCAVAARRGRDGRRDAARPAARVIRARAAVGARLRRRRRAGVLPLQDRPARLAHDRLRPFAARDDAPLVVLLHVARPRRAGGGRL